MSWLVARYRAFRDARHADRIEHPVLRAEHVDARLDLIEDEAPLLIGGRAIIAPGDGHDGVPQRALCRLS